MSSVDFKSACLRIKITPSTNRNPSHAPYKDPWQYNIDAGGLKIVLEYRVVSGVGDAKAAVRIHGQGEDR